MPRPDPADYMVYVLLFGIFSLLINALGIYLVQTQGHRFDRIERGILAFASGFVIGIALLHFGPELAHHAPHQFPWIAVSFFGLYLLERHFIPHFHTHGTDHPEDARKQNLGIMTAIGFGAHAIFDGLTIGVGFAFSTETGWMAAFAILVHELPEAITTFSLLRYSGMTETQSVRYALGIGAVTPIFAVLSFLFLPHPDTESLGVAFALATGSLLYIGTADLLPETQHATGWRLTMLLVLGVLMAYGLSQMGHAHV